VRRGVKFTSYVSEPEKTEIFGIPIIYDPYSPHVAMARGLWFNRKIVVGPKWTLMDQRTAHAVALHEARHCQAFHMEKRVLGFALLCTPALLLPIKITLALILFFALFTFVEEWFSRQELEADRFAVDAGYGVELLRWVMLHPQSPPFYPSFEQRCRALEKGATGKGSASMGFWKRIFNLGITANEAVVTGYRQPIGYQQILTAGLVAATKLTIPSKTVNNPTNGTTTQLQSPGYAVIQNSGTSAVRWRDDGTAPTASLGMLIQPGGELDYVGDLNNIQFIEVAAGAQLEVSLYL
jgi:hypothetical protein